MEQGVYVMIVFAKILPGVALGVIAFALVGIDTAFAFIADGASPPAGAPGPIAGAGLLPILAIGYGAYWLVKRYRRKID
jgi:hypothetical protein